MVPTEPLIVELKTFSSLSCRPTTLFPRVRLSWRLNRLLLRVQPRAKWNIWSSNRPISKPPLSTSSPQPPMAAARVKSTSQNPELYQPQSDLACTPQQLLCSLTNTHMDTCSAKWGMTWGPAQFYVSARRWRSRKLPELCEKTKLREREMQSFVFNRLYEQRLNWTCCKETALENISIETAENRVIISLY